MRKNLDHLRRRRSEHKGTNLVKSIFQACMPLRRFPGMSFCVERIEFFMQDVFELFDVIARHVR